MPKLPFGFAISLFGPVLVYDSSKYWVGSCSCFSGDKVRYVFDDHISSLFFHNVVDNISPLQPNSKRKPIVDFLQVFWVVQLIKVTDFP